MRRKGVRGPTRPAPRTPTVPDATLEASLWTAVGLLTALGIVMIYSATAPLALGDVMPPHFLRHGAALLVGLTCALALRRVPTDWWGRAALPLWLVTLALLVATALWGVRVNGARRWLELFGQVRVQPGELAKWATLLLAAALLARERGRAGPSRRGAALVAAIGLPPLALLLLQPDLGNALLLALMLCALLFVAGVPLRVLAAPGLALAGGLALYVRLRPYAFERLVGFLQPWERSQDEGFQLVQSFVAFGRGGLLGVGFGDGRQKLSYLPEAHTDFILSVVAEELGLVGVLVVLGGFAALVVAGMRIARRARGSFSLLAAFAMTLLLTVPALVNAAVVTGLLPTKGLALPFLSYGRSSLLVSFLAVGVLCGVARGGLGAPPRRAPAGVRA